MKEQISILGCGWLGLDLAKTLVEEGASVKGSTTSINKLTEIKSHGITPYLVELTEHGLSGDYHSFLKDTTTIIVNIPPGLRKDANKNHVAELSLLIKQIENHNIKHVLYISSTSVFMDETHFPVITDSTLPNSTSASAKQLIEIEKLLQINSKFKTTILRFGGLFDEERHPAKYLSGKKNISNPNAPINLIHKTDCIKIIFQILKKQFWNSAINAAFPKHPTKANYYTSYCMARNLPIPQFNTTEESFGKIIESTSVVQLLKYTFKLTP